MLTRRMPRLSGWTVTGIATVAILGSSFAAWAKPAPKKPGLAGNPNLIAQGKKLYENLGCGNCHKIGTQGGQAGPALDGTGKRRDAKFLTQKLNTPKFNNPNSIMPPIAKPAKDVAAVVAYLTSLK